MSKIKDWEELTVSDNFIFQKVMQNESLCRQFIEKLLGICVKNITYPITEKNIAVGAVSKSVRLDLYVETEEGIIIDIEIQTTNGIEGWLAKRARYYQSMIDLDVLGKGRDYVELNKSYIVFICTFDPFGYNEKIYTFSNKCHEKADLELGDEAVKIFLNTKGVDGIINTDIDSFLAYVDGKAAEGQFTREIAAEVEKIKQHNETKVEYMTLMMELKEQRREGFNEGKESERLLTIRNLMETLNFTARQAMDAMKIPHEEQNKYVGKF